MNKKGIIFTIDALIALTIFIVVVIVIYSLITPSQSVNIQGSSIYANAENFIRAEDTADKLADAFKEWQVSGASAAEAKLRDILGDLQYRANMRVYQKDDEGNVLDAIEIVDHEFDSSIIVRKFLVLSIQKTSGDFGECIELAGGTPVQDKELLNTGLQSFEPIYTIGEITREDFSVDYICHDCGQGCPPFSRPCP